MLRTVPSILTKTFAKKHFYSTMQSTGVYLTFDQGKCAEAFAFYETVFDKKVSVTMTYKDSPMADQTPADQQHYILHTSLELGPKFSVMGCDRNPVMHKEPHASGNQVSVTLTPTSQVETERIFAAFVENGGTTTMPLAKQFWGSLFGTLTDKYGIQWMLDFALPNDEKKEEEAASNGNKHALDTGSDDSNNSDNKKVKA